MRRAEFDQSLGLLVNRSQTEVMGYLGTDSPETQRVRRTGLTLLLIASVQVGDKGLLRWREESFDVHGSVGLSKRRHHPVVQRKNGTHTVLIGQGFEVRAGRSGHVNRDNAGGDSLVVGAEAIGRFAHD